MIVFMMNKSTITGKLGTSFIVIINQSEDDNNLESLT
jgi:hypothetical protein